MALLWVQPTANATVLDPPLECKRTQVDLKAIWASFSAALVAGERERALQIVWHKRPSNLEKFIREESSEFLELFAQARVGVLHVNCDGTMARLDLEWTKDSRWVKGGALFLFYEGAWYIDALEQD